MSDQLQSIDMFLERDDITIGNIAQLLQFVPPNLATYIYTKLDQQTIFMLQKKSFE